MDTPPIASTDDALVIAPRIDATLLVVAEGITRRESLQRTIGESGDERFLAWQIFRRLCFYDLDEEALEALAARSERLTAAVTLEDRLLGALCAYRMGRWPLERFSSGTFDEEKKR